MKIQKYLSLFLFCGLTVLLMGCSSTPKTESSINIKIRTDESNNSAQEYITLTGEEIAEEAIRKQFRKKADYIIADAFQGEVYINITDTENCNSYKNNEYGFALTFPPREAGNTCKVLKRISLIDSGAISISFEFLLPDDPKKGNGLLSNPTILYNTPLFIFDPKNENYDTGPIPLYGRYASFGLVIMNEQAYQDSHRNDGIGGRERMEQNIIGTNNKYYFLTWQYPEYSYFKLGYGSGDLETEIGQRYTNNHIVIFDVEELLM